VEIYLQDQTLSKRYLWNNEHTGPYSLHSAYMYDVSMENTNRHVRRRRETRGKWKSRELNV